MLKRNTQLYNGFLHGLPTLPHISLWFRAFNTIRIYKLCNTELNTYILKIFQLPATFTIHTWLNFNGDGFSSEPRELPLVISEPWLLLVYRWFVDVFKFHNTHHQLTLVRQALKTRKPWTIYFITVWDSSAMWDQDLVEDWTWDVLCSI